ncbi:hypothetical protein C0992_008565, partial [Termitomyces sp. T32_za158]
IPAPPTLQTKFAPVEEAISDPPIGQRPAPKDQELAESGMQVARDKAFRDRYIHASVHVGLPVVGYLFCSAPEADYTESYASRNLLIG